MTAEPRASAGLVLLGPCQRHITAGSIVVGDKLAREGWLTLQELQPQEDPVLQVPEQQFEQELIVG